MKTGDRAGGAYPWAWPGRPRVLIDDGGEEPGSPLIEGLRQAGFAVAVCPGPGRGKSAPGCPLVEQCPLVEGTDVVVVLDLERDESREELAALRAGNPGPSIVVPASAEDGSRWPQSVAGATVVDTLLPVQALVEAVTAAARAGQPSLL